MTERHTVSVVGGVLLIVCVVESPEKLSGMGMRRLIIVQAAAADHGRDGWRRKKMKKTNEDSKTWGKKSFVFLFKVTKNNK